MAGTLPPPPVNDQIGSFTWLEWYRQLRNYVSTSGSVPWYIINFAGSNITDIASRSHNNMQVLQGGATGQMYHLTEAQYTQIVNNIHNSMSGLQGGATDEYYHLTSAQATNVATIASGLNVTITTAKLTTGGTNGSMTFTKGILTAHTQAT